MTCYLIDPDGWLTGSSAEPVPGAVTEQPPAHDAEPVPGAPWPRYWRAGWMLDRYPLPPTEPTAAAFDAEGWYTGEVPLGSVGSTRARPDLLSTTTTPGEPRARYQAGAWTVQAYAPAPRHLTKRAFWGRFPALNEMAMRAVMASGQPLLLAAGLLRLNARVEGSPWVDLDLDETQGGIAWCASPDLPELIDIGGQLLPLRLSAEQAAHILTSPISTTERP